MANVLDESVNPENEEEFNKELEEMEFLDIITGTRRVENEQAFEEDRYHVMCQIG